MTMGGNGERARLALYIVSFVAVTALLLANVLPLSEIGTVNRAPSMLRRGIQTVLATASLAGVVYGHQVLDLSTVDWTLTSPNFSYISVPGKVPSQVHLDLQAAQVCGDLRLGNMC